MEPLVQPVAVAVQPVVVRVQVHADVHVQTVAVIVPQGPAFYNCNILTDNNCSARVMCISGEFFPRDFFSSCLRKLY